NTENTPFSRLQMLPKNGSAIIRWRSHDAAFEDVAKEIGNVVKELLTKQRLHEGALLFSSARYEEALVAYEEAIRLDHSNALAYSGKGAILYTFKRYEEALTAYEQAIRLAPNEITYNSKGNILNQLKRYDEALVAYEQAICHDPNYAPAYTGKG